MRICFLGDSNSIHVQKFCNSFAQLGHEIHLITYGETIIDGISTHRIKVGTITAKGKNFKILLTSRKVKKLITIIKPDLLHALYATSYGYIGSKTKFHPFIITAQGSDVLISPWQSRVLKFLVTKALKSADLITVVAQHMIKPIEKLGISSNKIHVTTLGVDTTLFNADEKKIIHSTFEILSLRSFEPVYNIDILIKALYLVKAQIPNIKLVMAGKGSQLNGIKQLVSELELDNNVSFIGQITQSEIAERLKKCHAYISLSKSDGNSIALNEALACGCFAIVSDIEANKPWIKDGVNGFLVPQNNEKEIADKIIEFFENYENLMNLAIHYNKPLISEKADWNKNVIIIENYYNNLIKSNHTKN